MLFLQGPEVIFKVALSLLGSHKPLILQHDSLESIVDFIKTTLPNLGLVQMEKTINQVRTRGRSFRNGSLLVFVIIPANLDTFGQVVTNVCVNDYSISMDMNGLC